MGRPGHASNIETFTSVPHDLLDLLTAHLPYSLTLLRRLQSAAYKNLTKSDARVILSPVRAAVMHGSSRLQHFCVAYAEFSAGPETQMFMYSSMEPESADVKDPAHEENIMSVVGGLVRLRKEYDGRLVYGHGLLLGSLHSRVCKILIKHRRVEMRPTGNYEKFLFRMENVPEPREIPKEMHWGKASLEDCGLVASRAAVPRLPQSLVKLPGLMLKLQDETPICWAFIDLDGSLISVHCEEGYRRRGLAKTLAAKLLRQAVQAYSDDMFAGSDWFSADVSPDNRQSHALCLSLNGTPRWSVSWVFLDVTEPV
ncbi:uncharacterized protein UV8b_05617 [Ustilaginoidea virens]|uniref:FR47-like domain-containing protein n=1 Tax=Ustilaginoidea virens TaxID=1159556 RepID=A0A8E5HU99_USTVR|nr:uncharacterized protein UV8b_05617 [Ustilaginoidea virens]QUC21374.1 hypothetical protein UV8b_05617 [Ustilaginoidea virens]